MAGLAVAAYEPHRDRVALKCLAQKTLRFSPVVEAIEPDTLLADITGCQRLFGGEERLARQAASEIQRQGFTVRAAIGDTVGAAYAVATAGAELLIIVPSGQTRAYLEPLPISALRIGPAVCERLEALGIRRVRDLLTLPRAALPARFGQQLVLRLQQALGEVFEGLTPYQPEETLTSRWLFETPVSDWSIVCSVAQHLLVELFKQLMQRELALVRLDCILHQEGAGPQVVSIGLARASRQPGHVAALLAQKLEQVGNGGRPRPALPGPRPLITGLTLAARRTEPWHAPQGELFQPSRPADGEALGELVDRLTSRLGYEAVLRPRLVDDHQPEMAFRYLSIAQTGCEPEPIVSPVGPPRPVRLLAHPVPIRVVALAPDGPPTWFAYRGREYPVASAAGPERLETAWWRGPDIRRDYFRVTADSGEMFWLLRTCDDSDSSTVPQWYLHGIFA